mgnify:CR=1 FL=1
MAGSSRSRLSRRCRSHTTILNWLFVLATSWICKQDTSLSKRQYLYFRNSKRVQNQSDGIIVLFVDYCTGTTNAGNLFYKLLIRNVRGMEWKLLAKKFGPPQTCTWGHTILLLKPSGIYLRLSEEDLSPDAGLHSKYTSKYDSPWQAHAVPLFFLWITVYLGTSTSTLNSSWQLAG